MRLVGVKLKENRGFGVGVAGGGGVCRKENIAAAKTVRKTPKFI